MAAKFAAPPPQVQGLPTCFFPGCTDPAPFGYGVSRRSFGRHFCRQHRPDQDVQSAGKPVASEVKDDR